MAGDRKGIKLVAQNKRARHDYFILDTWEAGIELKGTEVKSMRLGKCNLKDCYAQVVNGEMLVYGMHISPYEKGSYFNTDPLRPKRLLMHKAEI
ncbi:MAG: SsrA-binding protein, partial [Aristaeellaceae bacterium]